MAKSKVAPTIIRAPIDASDIRARFLTKMDALYAFCQANDIPHEDDEYDTENLIFNTFCDVVIDTYGDLMDETAVAVFKKKGFLVVDGQDVDDAAEARIYVFEMEPALPLITAYADEVIMKIHDPDVAMLVKLKLP